MVYLVSIRYFCPVLYLIACSFVYILFFFGITVQHNSPRGIYSLPFLAPMLISPFQKHSNLPFCFIPAQFCSNTGPQCKIRDKQKENDFECGRGWIWT